MEELTILIPCLNEEKTIASCIIKAKKFLEDNNINGEILISDNGSEDLSRKIAIDLNARVIDVSKRGYGSALRIGSQVSLGKYVIMADSDGSYDFSDLMPILVKLREGYDLVVGNRFKGGIEKGAMPFLNKWIGNPILSFIGKTMYKTEISDFHCGLRGYNREKIENLKLSCDGMEYASEMIIVAKINNLSMCEVPVQLFKSGRERKSHLRPFRDGTRHLITLIKYYKKQKNYEISSSNNA